MNVRTDAAPLDILVVSQASGFEINRRVYRRLRDLGWTVEIVTDAFFPGTARATEPQAEWETALHRMERYGCRSRYYSYRGLPALLDKVRPRAVLLDLEPDSFLAWQLGRWCRRNNARFLIQSCENLPAHFWRSLGRGRISRAVRAGIMRTINFLTRPLIAHVFAISSGVMEQMHRLGYEGRCSVIPLGFDPAIFVCSPELREQKRRELRLVHPTVAYFGRLLPIKGVHLIIKALAALKHCEWHFLIDDFTGAGSDYATRLIALIAEHDIKDRVVFFHASHGEMPAFMNAADIVVLPSITTATTKEQYGRVVPEAMACGRPVIVSDFGALPELVGGSGRIVPEDDVKSLSAAIANMLTNEPERRRLGEA
ncbi:MAG: glycosyltransferase family 4 protein, partial [Chthoniobacteraceae bacterium]